MVCIFKFLQKFLMLNTFTVLLVLICRVAAYHVEDYYNFGTVLFSPDDLAKKRWRMKDMVLLKARETLLDVIPPPELLNIQNNNLAPSLLIYFQDTVKTLKKENLDPELRPIVLTALTDTLGGYMKKWVLPIIKYSYYGGTIGQDDALELFGFHDEIKLFLNTDGAAWHKPTAPFLNSIAINVAPLDLRQAHTRSITYACDDLAYLMKTSSGLEVPVPNINWDKDSESMFIPLKSGSLVSLNSRNASESLFNYYDTVKKCSNATHDESCNEFDERIQDWLSNEVLPHLNDDKIYPGLRSILSLVNRTRNLCDSVLDLYNMNNAKNKSSSFISIYLSSKKMVVITIIIILEVIWCIPTLCYLMYNKVKQVRMNRKNHDPNNNVYFFIVPKKQSWSNSTRVSQQLNFQSLPEQSMSQLEPKYSLDKALTAKYSTRSAYFGPSSMTKNKNIEIIPKGNSVHSAGTCTRYNFTCQLRHKSTPHIDEKVGQDVSRATKSTSSMKLQKVTISKEHSTMSLSKEIGLARKASKTASFMTVQNLQPTKTVTILHDRQTTGLKEISRTDKCSAELMRKKSQIRQSSTSADANKKKPHRVNVDKSKKPDKLDSPTPSRCKQTIAELEITINNPPKDIHLDIAQHRSKVKPSKIPKRYYTTSTMKTQTTKKDWHNCRIPQWKKAGTVDDTATEIANKKTASKSKLNATL